MGTIGKLKAYTVHDGRPDENAVLVFARTVQEAKKLGYQWNDVGCDEGFFSVRANRLMSMDIWAKEDNDKGKRRTGSPSA